MKFLNSISTLLLALAALTACSGIDDDHRFVPVDKVESTRNVLLLDFTGQNCVNCPDAHEVVEGITSRYPDNVIPVAVHAGQFGIKVTSYYPSSGYIGLMQPVGDEYANHFGVSAYPAGVIDGAKPEIYSTWPGLVEKALKVPSEMSIFVMPNVVNDTLYIRTTVTPGATVSGAKLLVWVLEDSIKARQKFENKPQENFYVHNHVLRAAVNGTWGESISLQNGVHQTYNHKIAVNDGSDKSQPQPWVAKNLSVVAFVYNEKTGAVLQSAKGHAIIGQLLGEK